MSLYFVFFLSVYAAYHFIILSYFFFFSFICKYINTRIVNFAYHIFYLCFFVKIFFLFFRRLCKNFLSLFNSVKRIMLEIINESENLLSSEDTAGEVTATVTEANLFGKYELGKLVGYGGFGKVYHAKHASTGQNVALKAISKQKVLKGGFTARVKREISIMRRLRHPNIVRLSEVLATKTKIYFVMEFAKGGELFNKLEKGRFSEDLSRRYFQQLISAVGYCHSHGVYHRDLKPENLLLDENWDLKVADFGLSAVSDQIRPDGLLHTLCGTPAYVAPDILAKKGYDGSKVDVWSCGIILYVMTAGYLPFNDYNLMAMYRKIFKGQFRCPKWMSPELKHLLSRLLDPNPHTRITVAEILEDPWFREGYKDIKFCCEAFELKDNDGGRSSLNAFDIILFSRGFDLSGLFNQPEGAAGGERFVSAASPEMIAGRMEEVAKAEGLTVARKAWGVKVEGHNGHFMAVAEIHRLTEELVVVDIKRRETGAEPGRGIWKDKFRPLLNSLIYQPEGQVAGI